MRPLLPFCPMRRSQMTARFLLLNILYILFALSFLWIIQSSVLGPLLYSTVYLRPPTYEVCSDDQSAVAQVMSSIPFAFSPWLVIVTPTYARSSQLPDLVRLRQTLEASLVVSKCSSTTAFQILWIVVEDSAEGCSPNDVLQSVLSTDDKSGLWPVHLRSWMPEEFKTWEFLPSGVANRNGAIKWLRESFANSSEELHAVVYFADDDNTFSTSLFESLARFAETARRGSSSGRHQVAVFPVGLVGKFGFSAPVVSMNKVVSFHDGWPAYRSFPVDMAGFAVPLSLVLLKPDAYMPFHPGFEETKFLEYLGVQMSDLYPIDPTDLYAWHTRTICPTSRHYGL